MVIMVLDLYKTKFAYNIKNEVDYMASKINSTISYGQEDQLIFCLYIVM